MLLSHHVGLRFVTLYKFYCIVFYCIVLYYSVCCMYSGLDDSWTFGRIFSDATDFPFGRPRA